MSSPSREYTEGFWAYGLGKGEHENPYGAGEDGYESQAYKDWFQGYCDAVDSTEEIKS